MKFLRNFPIELYLIFFPFLIVFLFFACAVIFGFVPSDLVPFNLDQDALLGNRYFFFFLSLVYFCVILRTGRLILALLKQYKSKEITLKVVLQKIIQTFLTIFFWIFLFYSTTLISGYSLGYIFRNVSVGDVEYFSNIFMQADYFIFGVYPAFWFQHLIIYKPLGFLTVFAYKNIVFVISGVLVFALFLNTYLLRKFIIAFIVAGFIGLPIWALFPAISPQSMYLENILNVEIPASIETRITNPFIEQNIQNHLPIEYKNWVDPKGELFAVSTFPSMHTAWGLIVLIIGVSLYRPFIVVLLPWFIFNIIGTMAIFEHYAVDVIAGMLLGILALLIAEYSLQYEKKYLIDRYKLVDFWEHFQKDGKKTSQYIVEKLKRLM